MAFLNADQGGLSREAAQIALLSTSVTSFIGTKIALWTLNYEPKRLNFQQMAKGSHWSVQQAG